MPSADEVTKTRASGDRLVDVVAAEPVVGERDVQPPSVGLAAMLPPDGTRICIPVRVGRPSDVHGEVPGAVLLVGDVDRRGEGHATVSRAHDQVLAFELLPGFPRGLVLTVLERDVHSAVGSGHRVGELVLVTFAGRTGCLEGAVLAR